MQDDVSKKERKKRLDRMFNFSTAIVTSLLNGTKSFKSFKYLCLDINYKY